jgi:hypothetical protein
MEGVGHQGESTITDKYLSHEKSFKPLPSESMSIYMYPHHTNLLHHKRQQEQKCGKHRITCLYQMIKVSLGTDRVDARSPEEWLYIRASESIYQILGYDHFLILQPLKQLQILRCAPF